MSVKKARERERETVRMKRRKRRRKRNDCKFEINKGMANARRRKEMAYKYYKYINRYIFAKERIAKSGERERENRESRDWSGFKKHDYM